MRLLRKALVMGLLAAYLVACVAHGFHDLDLTNPSHAVVVSIGEHGDHQSGKHAGGGHHCHGCFMVSMPTPITIAAAIEVVDQLVVQPEVQHHGQSRSLDPPPPKFLS